jgi:4-amino-4-deoxy-L-arabinose transferase-like glycosyltransferase
MRTANSQMALLLFVAGLVLYALPAARHDLWNPDEPRYAEIAREMSVTREWFIPKLDGKTFLEEPPLQHWLVIGAGLGDVTAWSARAPAAFTASLALAAVFLLGSWLFSRWVGLASAFFLGTAFEFWWLAGRAQVDMLLAASVLVAVAGFAASERFPERRAAGLVVFYLAATVGFLAKGLLGPGLPGLAVVAYLLWDRRSLRGHWAHLIAGSLFLLAVIVAWGLILSRHGGAANVTEYFVRQHLQRFTGGHDHQGPFWYYFAIFPVVFLPWTLLVPAGFVGLRGAFARDKEESRWLRLVAAWFLSGFALLTLASTKRETYLVPIFPAAAVLLAVGLEHAWDRLAVRSVLRDRSIIYYVFGALLLVGLATIPVLWAVLGWRPDTVGIVALAGVGAVLGRNFKPGRWREGRNFPLELPALAAVLLWAISMAALPAVDLRKSARPLSEATRRATGADGRIFFYHVSEGVLGAYTFYLDRLIPNVATAEEVRSAMAPPGRALFILNAPDLPALEKAAGTPFRKVAEDKVGHRRMVVVEADRKR